MTQDFYDALAPFYHLLYADWGASMARQCRGAAAVLTEFGVGPGSAVDLQTLQRLMQEADFETVTRRNDQFSSHRWSASMRLANGPCRFRRSPARAPRRKI